MRRLLALTICLFGLTLAAGADAANYELNPSSAAFVEGCEVSVDLDIDTEGETSDAANVFVYYNPAEIEFVDKDGFNAGVQVQTGNAYQSYFDNTAEPGGEMRLTGFTIFGGFNGTRTFGTLFFRSLPGIVSSNLTILYNPGDTHDSNIAQKDTGIDLLDGVINGTYTFTPGFCVPDVVAPWVTDASPYNGQTNYPLDGDVFFDLNDDQSGVDLDTVVITINGIAYSIAGPNIFSYIGNPLNYDIIVDPIVDFPDGLEIPISVYGCDVDGNCRLTEWTFNEDAPPPPVDNTPPWVTNASPYNGQTNYPLDGDVEFHLNDDLSGVDINTVIATVDGVDYSLTGPYFFNYSGDVFDYFIEIDTVADFPDQTEITISVYGCDVAGNCKTTVWRFNKPPPPPPTCEEIIDNCSNLYETYSCEIEEVVCDDCPVCEESVIDGLGVVEEELDLPLVTAELLIDRDAVTAFALSERVPLGIDPFGFFYVLPDVDYTIRLDETFLPQDVSSVQWFADGSRYALAESEGTFSGNFMSPASTGAYPTHLIVTYEDGTVDRLDFTLMNMPHGQVLAETENGSYLAQAGVQVTVLDAQGNVWDADYFLQENPTTTGADGSYGFLVPAGNYTLEYSYPGYDDERTDVAVQSVINAAGSMDLLPATLTEIIANPILAIDAVDFYLDELREVPGVPEAAAFSIPPMLLLALGNLILLALLFSLLPFLQYLFTAPFLLIARRKRKGWGIVYNSINKLPLDLAIVRLFKIPDITVGSAVPRRGQLVQTRISDQHGRYFFIADEGTYRLEVEKPGFDFPSEYVARVKDDGVYVDLYHGEQVEAKDKDSTIAKNIPMDPLERERYQTPRRVKVRLWFRKFQHGFALFGVILAILVAIILPTILTIVVAAIQVTTYVFVRMLTSVRKPKGWGSVTDKKSKQSLSNVVVRIFETTHNKLLETVITDKKGRYSFLVGANTYFIRFEKKGYRPVEVRPIDYSNIKKPVDITMDIKMERVQGISTVEEEALKAEVMAPPRGAGRAQKMTAKHEKPPKGADEVGPALKPPSTPPPPPAPKAPAASPPSKPAAGGPGKPPVPPSTNK